MERWHISTPEWPWRLTWPWRLAWVCVLFMFLGGIISWIFGG
jgi:hypothetical protein